jgi:hypothetical protein
MLCPTQPQASVRRRTICRFVGGVAFQWRWLPPAHLKRRAECGSLLPLFLGRGRSSIEEPSVSFCSKRRCQFWSRSLHQRYCKPRQNWGACLMRRISCRRVDSDSVENCWTMQRSADWRRSGNCSLFAPKGELEVAPNGEAEVVVVPPSTGTIEASGLAV